MAPMGATELWVDVPCSDTLYEEWPVEGVDPCAVSYVYPMNEECDGEEASLPKCCKPYFTCRSDDIELADPSPGLWKVIVRAEHLEAIKSQIESLSADGIAKFEDAIQQAQGQGA